MLVALSHSLVYKQTLQDNLQIIPAMEKGNFNNSCNEGRYS